MTHWNNLIGTLNYKKKEVTLVPHWSCWPSFVHFNGLLNILLLLNLMSSALFFHYKHRDKIFKSFFFFLIQVFSSLGYFSSCELKGFSLIIFSFSWSCTLSHPPRVPFWPLVLHMLFVYFFFFGCAGSLLLQGLFSSCRAQGLLFLAVPGFLFAVASLVVELVVATPGLYRAQAL